MSYVTIAERVYTQRALEQGREGQARILLGQLQRRFDSVPDEIAARVLGADVQQLETWSLDLMDAKTLDEVFLGR